MSLYGTSSEQDPERAEHPETESFFASAYTLDEDILADFREALQEQDSGRIETTLASLGAANTAELIERLEEGERLTLLGYYGAAIEPQAFPHIDPELRRECLEKMAPGRVAAIVTALDSDDALDLLVNLDEEFQKEIIRQLSAKTRAFVEEGLTFPEDSAGRLMQREFVAVPQYWDVGRTIDFLRDSSNQFPDGFFDIIVVDPKFHVMGEVALHRMIRAHRETRMTDLVRDVVHTIPAETDQEDVARLFRREGISSAPVVDSDGRLLGVITIDDVVDVIDEEAQEDFLKLGGVDRSDFYNAVLDTTRARFSWLGVNLVTAIIASVVIGFFEATLNQLAALAILMPIVASMGGNAGTQALTVAVRTLTTGALTRDNMLRVLWKETLVGALNGAGFAVLAAAVTYIWFGDFLLGLVIGAAMVVNLIVAGLCGAGIPVLLDRLGADPAVSSSVFLTTVTDVVGFFAFLGLASWLMF